MTNLFCLNFRKSALLLPALLLLAAGLFLPSGARAGAYTYDSGQERTVNAGVLLLDATSAGSDKDPYVFHVLNQRNDLRPYGWNIVNPLAPRNITGVIKTRWDTRDAANLYSLGQIVAPNMAAYWEVPLSLTAAADLLQYDILFLNLDTLNVSLQAADVEKLRRFVDAGGTLWVENSGGGSISAAAPLFFSLTFNSSGSTGYAALPPGYRHPIISSPYQLSEAELNALGDKHIGGYSQTFPATAGIQDGSTLLSDVLLNSASGNPIVSAGQLGAGEIVVTSTGTANNINEYVTGTLADNVEGANSGAYCGDNFQGASSQDLKFLSDIIAWSGAHPAEHQNSHQTGNATNALNAAVRTWNFPIADDPSTITAPAIASPPGATINGNIAYVTDAKGAVHAFDVIPGEDLDGDGNPDDGYADYGNGTPYDELWKPFNAGQFASAPTVAYDPRLAKNVLLVEQDSGAVLELDASTGMATGISPLAGSAGGAGQFSTNTLAACAPSPTVYNGRVYAAQPDTAISGTPPSGSRLFVYDLARSAAGNGTLVTLNQTPVVGEYVTASPAVGSVIGENGTDLIATVTTNQSMYTVFLGARGEALKDLNTVTNTNYNTKLPSLNPTAYMDTTGFASAVLRTYTIAGGLPTTQAATPAATAPNFTFGSATTSPFGDYDVDFAASAAAAVTANTTGPLTRLTVSASSSAIAPPTNTVFSAPAFDRSGSIYYTVGFTPLVGGGPANNSLVCAHDSSIANHATLPWRFRLPSTLDGPITDADGVNYAPLIGYHFVGSPVVDGQGFVYALATDGTGTAVLCFNTNASVTVDVFDPSTGVPVGGLTFTQPVPANGANTEFGDTNTFQLLANQYTQDPNNPGHVVFTSFAQNAGRQLYPDFSEPQPVTASYSAGSPDASTQTTVVRPLHTNLAWFTTTTDANKIPAPGTGLTLVGNRLFYGTGSGVQGVVADPSSEGFSITNKFIALPTMFVSAEASGVGGIGAVPSSSHGVMVLNGQGGIAALTDRITVVTDNNRVLEMDGNGNALWTVDATTETTVAGGAAPNESGLAPGAGTGQYVTSTVELNRPNSLTELTPNDYLIADTGNNRCVRFDRSGQVVWELSAFTDPGGLLAPGQPLTLNQPTSVQIYYTVQKNSAGAVTGSIVQYLIADTGNYRVVEIDDRYNANNQPLDQNGNVVTSPLHILAWVSHTADKQGRQYRYQSAAYYVSPDYATSKKLFVVALVANTRLALIPAPASPPTGALGPANADAPGGSIVLLDYDPSGANAANQANGYVAYAFSSFKANLTGTGMFDINGVTKGTAGTPATLQIRNPRYLKAYSPPGASGTQRNFLLADDNGVFDIVGANFTAQWGFTQADYRAMPAPIAGTTLYSRAAIPFVPASLQRVSTDAVTAGANTYSIGRYLITQSYSQSDLVTNTNTIGGEVFELNTLNNGGTLETDEVHYNLATNSFSGHTTSRPVNNTSPLVQPTFAYRLQ